MKNLLISKSFSYEIVDSTLLRQTNTYHLGVLKHIFFLLLFCDIEYHTVIENTRFFNDAAIIQYQLFMPYITQYHTVLLAVLLARENMLCFISYQL